MVKTQAWSFGGGGIAIGHCNYIWMNEQICLLTEAAAFCLQQHLTCLVNSTILTDDKARQ